MKRKQFAAALAALCIALNLCGCAEKTDNLNFTGAVTEEPEYQDKLNAVSPAAYGTVESLDLAPGTYISIIGKDESSAYWNEISEGVLQAAADLNERLGYKGDDRIKVTYNAPAKVENIDEQVNILDEELARYPDIIGIASIDADACAVQFDLAAENGIPIIALDSGNSYQGILCTVKTDNQDAARTGAYKLADEIDNDGEIILLVHDSKSETAAEREEGFRKEIEENQPGVTIAETIYCDQLDDLKKQMLEEQRAEQEQTAEGQAVQGQNDAVNAEAASEQEAVDISAVSDEEVIRYFMEKHENVKGVFGTNVTATQLALTTLRDMEQTEQVVLMGFDAGKNQIDALSSGEISGLVVQNPFGMGYAAVVAAARTVLEAGNEAEVNTGYVWVTPDNMEETTIQKMLYE